MKTKKFLCIFIFYFLFINIFATQDKTYDQICLDKSACPKILTLTNLGGLVKAGINVRVQNNSKKLAIKFKISAIQSGQEYECNSGIKNVNPQSSIELFNISCTVPNTGPFLLIAGPYSNAISLSLQNFLFVGSTGNGGEVIGFNISDMNQAQYTITSPNGIGGFLYIAADNIRKRLYFTSDLFPSGFHVLNAENPNNLTITSFNKSLTESEGIAVSPDGTKVYVSEFIGLSGSIHVYSVNESFDLLRTFNLGNELSAIATHPDGSKIYVAAVNTGVEVLDSMVNPITTIQGFPSTSNVVTVVINNDGSRVYAVDLVNNSVYVIDTNTNSVIGSPIIIGNSPRGAILSSDSKVLYVANSDNTIHIIDTETNSVVNVINSEGQDPRGMSVSPDGLKLYVANLVSNRVAVFNISNPKSPVFIENINVPADLKYRQGNAILSL